MHIFKTKYKKLRGLHIENMQLLIKSIQYRTYKFMKRIFVYLSDMYRIFSLIIEYVPLYTICDIFVYHIHYTLVCLAYTRTILVFVYRLVT